MRKAELQKQEEIFIEGELKFMGSGLEPGTEPKYDE